MSYTYYCVPRWDLREIARSTPRGNRSSAVAPSTALPNDEHHPFGVRSVTSACELMCHVC